MASFKWGVYLVVYKLQNLYEAVRSDRNLYSKNLIESQDEITEMKRKLKIMNHQIDQLKEEIMAKEAALVKEHLEHQRVEKEKDALKAELQRMKQQAAESKAYIEQQEVEERKLLKIISEADGERLRQKKELDQVLLRTALLDLMLRIMRGQYWIIINSLIHTANSPFIIYLSTEFMLGDHILYSHNFSDWEGVDVAKRNLTLITIEA